MSRQATPLRKVEDGFEQMNVLVVLNSIFNCSIVNCPTALPNAEVCDATDDDSSNVAGLKIENSNRE
jgi:hypothetical protein